jgi:hypothetical protein
MNQSNWSKLLGATRNVVHDTMPKENAELTGNVAMRLLRQPFAGTFRGAFVAVPSKVRQKKK